MVPRPGPHRIMGIITTQNALIPTSKAPTVLLSLSTV